MPLAPTPNDMKRDNRQLEVFGILRPGVKIQAANTEIAAISKRLAAQYPDTDKNTTANVMTFHERYNGGNIEMVFILMLASVAIRAPHRLRQRRQHDAQPRHRPPA